MLSLATSPIIENRRQKHKLTGGCRRDGILEARAKRNARRAARRARDEEELLVDVSNDAGGGAEMGVYDLREVRNVGVGGNMDEEDGLGGATVAKDAGGSGAKEVEKEG